MRMRRSIKLVVLLLLILVSLSSWPAWQRFQSGPIAKSQGGSLPPDEITVLRRDMHGYDVKSSTMAQLKSNAETTTQTFPEALTSLPPTKMASPLARSTKRPSEDPKNANSNPPLPTSNLSTRKAAETAKQALACSNLPRFRFDETGKFYSWLGSQPPVAQTGPWSSMANDDWSLTPEIVSFLNEFLEQQHRILCETPFSDQRILIVRRNFALGMSTTGFGLGNSVQAAISFLVLGFLSNRAVLLADWQKFGDVFDTPLAWYTYEYLNSKGLTSKIVSQAHKRCVRSRTMGCIDFSEKDQWWWCEDVNKMWPPNVTSVVGCCSNYLPLIMRNWRYGPRLRKAFNKAELAVPLYRTLFRPSKNAIASAAKTVSMLRGGNAGRYIALQIRVFEPYMTKNVIAAFAGCTQHLLAQPEYRGAPVYVAAISGKIIKQISSALGNITRVVRSTPPEGEIHDTAAWLVVLHDAWLLAQADALIVTPWSSLGTFAAALGRKAPWELEGTMNAVTGKCQQVLSNEPCCMRNWGPPPDSCPPKKGAPLKFPRELDRRCGFDNGGWNPKVKWKGLSIR